MPALPPLPRIAQPAPARRLVSWRRRSPWPPVGLPAPAVAGAFRGFLCHRQLGHPHPRPGSCRPRCAHPSCRHEWSSPRQRNHPRWPRRGVAAETADPAHPTNWREACPSRCSGTDVAPPERRNKAAQSDSPPSVCLAWPVLSGAGQPIKSRRPSWASERQGRDAVAGPGARIPSDSRHLLGLGQALLRRGKQMSGRTHGEPRATRLLMGSPPAHKTPALLWCRCSGHGGLRSSATSANGRLVVHLVFA